MSLKKLERSYKKCIWHFKKFGFGGGMAALKGSLSGTQNRFSITPKGFKHPVTLRLPSSDGEVYKQVFLDKEYDCVAESAPRVIIDAGANCGLTSVYYATKFPEAKIIAIEPEKGNFELMKENVDQYPNVVPIRAALWSERGTVVVDDPGEGAWSFRARGTDGDLTGLETVDAVTVESIMDEHGIDRVCLLKMDIEGSELEVFKHAQGWIDRVDTVVVELHERFKPGCTRAFYDATTFTDGGFDRERHMNEHVWIGRAGGAWPAV